MSKSLGGSLPPDLLARLSHVDLASRLGKALPLITVDNQGWPHPMLLSYLEVRAVDPRTVRIVIGARSRSARNLLERQAGALLLIEPEQTIYVKLRVADGPFPVPTLADFGLFVLSVEEVLEDAPGEWEASTGITEGIRYSPVPSLDEPWARATLAALAR